MTDVVSDYKVKVQSPKTCEKLISIEVPSEHISKEYSFFYDSVAPNAKVPGFRPGKAPRDVLEMHYEKDADKSVLETLISTSLRKVLEENTINPITSPVVEDVNFDKKKLAYKARVEVRPKIKLSKVKGLSAKKDKVEVKAEEVDKTIDQIRDSQGSFKVVEGRAAELGDFVIADYICNVEGKQIEDRKDDWIEIKEEDYLKDFSKQLVGVNAGDEKTVEVEFPKDMANKDMAGKKASFEMKIKEIKAKQLPELDDEFAKSQSNEFETLADLKKKIEEDIKSQKEKEVEFKLEKDLLDSLVKNNKLDVPQGLVKKRLEYLIDQSKKRFASQGLDESFFEGQKEKMEKEMEPEAKKQVQLGFLLDEIARQENIEVGDEDMEKKYEALSKDYHQPVQTIKDFYGQNQEALYGLKDQVRSEKAIDLIKENAKIK